MRISMGASCGFLLPAAEIAGQEQAVAQANSNERPAGVMAGGVLTLRMTASQVRWHPEAEDGPFLTVETFGEEGEAATIPGPLIRVVSGTRVETAVRNALPDTLLVFGLSQSGSAPDTLRIPPGATGLARMTAGEPGTYVYGGATIVGDSVHLLGTGNQLVGAFIVDGPEPRRDRVFVMSIWPPSPGRFVMAINGKSWPHTERLDVNVGDSVHWRVINATRGRHPMHLHGFYFRIDARGSWSADTAIADERPYVVTESVPYRGTFSMTWTAERPGNWLFHCHDALHTTWRRRFNLAGEPPPASLPMHGSAHHVEQDMSGLVLGIRAHGGPAAVLAEPVRRARVRIQETPLFYGREPRLSYVITDSVSGERDSAETPQPPLVLTRGEPAAITVVNEMSIATAVHWHGIELDSYFDGVPGWSGEGTVTAPLIEPGDSFIVRMTPPRAGTFIFHAHVDDMRQIALGLSNALIVLPPGERWQPRTDHVFLISQLGRGRESQIGINGSASPAPMTLAAETVHRFRFINISIQDDAELVLSRNATSDTSVIAWRALAKDGADLPMERARSGSGPLRIAPGETYDFEVRLPAGDYRLRMKSFNDIDLRIHVPVNR
jgi:FtsP/CotA-like multicopper oxidase with cupredoxin domain